MNNKLILLQDKENYKVNIFTISEDSKLIPLFIDKQNDYLLHFEKVLPYFEGIELMLNDKYIFKEITQESYDELVKLLDLNQYKRQYSSNSIYYKKDDKYYVIQDVIENRFWLDNNLIFEVFEQRLNFNSDHYFYIKSLTILILNEVFKIKTYSVYSLSINLLKHKLNLK